MYASFLLISVEDFSFSEFNLFSCIFLFSVSKHGLLFQGSSSSSSATLAAKFTSRSATDAATRKEVPPPLPPGIPGKPKHADPVQNGVQHNEGNDIFSPLREGW